MTLPGEKFLDEVSGKWLTKSQIRRRRRQEAAWNAMFEKLREFKRVHNHCNVLRSDPDRELSSWVHTQRNRSAGGEEIGSGAALLCRSFVASNDLPPILEPPQACSSRTSASFWRTSDSSSF
jgi:Helicase associated domain